MPLRNGLSKACLVSLLDMLRFHAGAFHLKCSSLRATLDGLLHQMDERGYGAPISEQEIAEALAIVEALYPECERGQLTRAIERLDELRLLLPCSINDPRPLADVKAFLEELDIAIGKDLGARIFLHIPKPDADYYDRTDLFGAIVEDKFPEANKEITLAGNCFATDNYTACVFHLMRAVETAARVMVVTLRVKKHFKNPRKPVELCEWGELYSALYEGVKTLRANNSRSAKAKATYEFYNHAVAQFGYFKDAWRNNVSHKRTNYQRGAAEDIMNSTRHLITHLAERLREAKSPQG